MKTKSIIDTARRAAMALLLVMMTATAWAQTTSFPTASGGTGTEGDPYLIATTADLDALAADVNSGTAYSATYFRMTADIDYAHTTDWDDATSTENNYTPIGNRVNSSTNHPFSGTFDGGGHTVSGIRIYRGGSAWTDSFLGLFGYVLNGTVKNVTVADARITGNRNCGGIAGYVIASKGTCTVENCHALSDVAIHAVVDGAVNHGGIAGSSGGITISGCTSAATLTAAIGLTGCDTFGGIVGNMTGGTMSHCLAIGVSIPVKPDGCRCGAIFGGNNFGSFDHNSYANCNVGGATTNIGGPWGDITTEVNTETGDIKNPDGAIPLDLAGDYIVTVGRGMTATGTTLNDDAPYYYRNSAGASVTLGYTGSVPTGYDFSFAVKQADGTAVSMTGASTFTMPAAHVSVSTTLNYALSGRTLYCDGAWNTLCLPFALATLTGTPLDGFTVKELDIETAYNGHLTGLDGTTLYLNFRDATTIEAGRPYILKKLATDDESTPTYTATAGTAGSLSQQGYANLVDGSKEGNRWRTDFTAGGKSFCEFRSDKTVYVTGYTLTTGNQAVAGDPTVWTLQAKLNESDAWTVIDSRNVSETPSDALPNGRTADKTYTLQHPGAYRYFRFEVTATDGNSFLCLTELTMQGKHLATGGDVVEPTFYDVTPGSADPVEVKSADGTVAFVGTYSPVGLTVDDQSNLFLGAANTLYWPNGANNADGKYYVGACRAYFHLSEPSLARAFVLNFGDDLGSETGIHEIEGDYKSPAHGSGIANSLEREAWYTLDGRRLAAKPTQHGVYINNGRKIVIK